MAIGKYAVSIANNPIKHVSQLQVYKFTRDETRTTSFAGTERVDRSAIKYKLSMVIGFCTAAEMQEIVTFASQITQDVTFPDGSSTVTKNMIISLPQVPQPIYKYGDKTKGVYYTDLRVDMEEA